ncbi:MAG: RsmD family RNA methyltransferase, partial [Actinomycetota bacterium]|nr:RsmD family RNA methyltransferase [Actinomycetota bacterium]
SRGAASAVFVDSDPTAVAVVRTNLEATGLAGTVVQADAVPFLDTVEERFDLVLADPPYAFDSWEELLARLPAPLAALESGEPVDPGPAWEVLRQRRYGETVVTIARRVGGRETP